MAAEDPMTAEKVLTLDALLARRAEARREGRALVQCHGCFDIVHPGHVRHLQYAKRQGDVLLVSITGDAAMRKGDGRPLIPQELRAENLAALDCVDWVHVHPSETAVGLLEKVQPDVYIKGKEYESNRDPRFQEEREIVERRGGRVVFSSGDVVFSSTALIAAMEDATNPGHAQLRRLVERESLTPKGAEALIESFRGARVCVVGEAIIDTYVMCDRPDIAGESPVMALRPVEWRSYDGGAAIIARHLAALGARVTLVTALPRSIEAAELKQRLAAEGVETIDTPCDGALLEKQRFLVGGQKVMKLDLIQPIALDAARREALIESAGQAARGCDAAIIADYGEGLLSPETMAALAARLRGEARVLSGDVSGRRSNLLRMTQMDLLTPSESELRDALRDYDTGLSAAVWELLSKTGSRAAVVTMGPDGMTAFSRLPVDEEPDQRAWRTRLASEHVPALSSHAVDQLGCGDALLAVATLALACGASLPAAAALGSVAAAAQAQKLGNAVITAAELRSGIARLVGSRLIVENKPAARLVV